MSGDISENRTANLLFVLYHTSSDGSSKRYLFHSYSKLHLQDLVADRITPLPPPLLSTEAYSMIYITYQIFHSSSVKYFNTAFWNSLCSTSSSKCMYAKVRGHLLSSWQTYFCKISPVFWKTCNTLAVPLVCKVLSWFRHVELFSLSEASWVPAKLWKCIQHTSALQSYCMLQFPACIWVWGNPCGWSNGSEVKHGHWVDFWHSSPQQNWINLQAIFSLGSWPNTHSLTCVYCTLLHHTASF